MNHTIQSIEWEHEDQLPEMEDVDYDHLFIESRVIDGVRMFPFITVYDNDTGEASRIYLRA